jgi:hypothetical protein
MMLVAAYPVFEAIEVVSVASRQKSIAVIFGKELSAFADVPVKIRGAFGLVLLEETNDYRCD